MQYKFHQVINVPHQLPAKAWECESFWDYAINTGELDAAEYSSLETARQEYADWDMELPETLANILQAGQAAIVLTVPGQEPDIVPAAGFDREEYAASVLGRDLNRMIVVDCEEEARRIAEGYKGHKEIEVRALARQIIERQRILA